MYMCAAIVQGKPCLGLQVDQTRIVYLTEQTTITYREAVRRAGLLDSEDLVALCLTDARHLHWQAIIEGAVAKAREIGAALIVVDTLGQFAGLAGDEENSSGKAVEAMAPLQDAAAQGFAILVLRHER